MRGAGQRLARVVHAEREDTRERVRALRLQAEAWRLLALVALREPDYAREGARWLLFHTLPFVDEPAVQTFIEGHRERARQAGIAAGVFQT